MSNQAIYNHVVKYEITAVCVSPLHIGSGEGEKGSILIHPVKKCPFLQASGIAGCFSDYMKSFVSASMLAELFGKSRQSKEETDSKSSLVFTDGLFETEGLILERRPRVKLDPETGTVKKATVVGGAKTSGQILDTEYITEGAKFSFSIYLFSKENVEAKSLAVKQALNGLAQGNLLFGGLTTSGCGQVKLTTVYETAYDLSDGKDRSLWPLEQKEKTNITKLVCEELKEKSRYTTISFHAELPQAVMIKGSYIDTDKACELMKCTDEKAARLDAMNMLNGNREFVLPGTSLKGLFRSRITAIAAYLGCNDVSELFENKSKVYFEDAIIKEEDARITNRIHINKMLGSVMDKAMVQEVPASGTAKLRIRIPEDYKDYKAICGLLLYVVRDLSIGAIAIGGENSIGRGFVSVGEITLRSSDGSSTVISAKDGSITGDHQKVTDCLQAVHDFCHQERSSKK